MSSAVAGCSRPVLPLMVAAQETGIVTACRRTDVTFARISSWHAPAPALSLVRQLDEAAFVMGETFAARAHGIDRAVGIDPAFERTRNPRSALTRELVIETFLKEMARVGLHPKPGAGGACEILEPISGGYANIRLRSAERRGESYYVRQNRASSFGEVDEALMAPDYPYVFGFTIDGDGQIRFFVAPVLRVIEGNPGELELGDAIPLGNSGTTVASSFEPDTDSWLPGFDADAEVDEGDEDQGRSA